jgi:fatty acid desaturase
VPAHSLGILAASNQESGIRDSMLALPGFMQLPITFLTGKPYTGQKPLRLAPAVHLVGPLISATVGLLIGVFALRWSGWSLLLLLPSWALILHAMRNLRMVVFHQCAHRNMWGQGYQSLEIFVGDVVAGMLLVQSFNRYTSSHGQDHHGIHLMTLRDPTVYDFLVLLGLSPTMTRKEMWRKIVSTSSSPAFHARFFASRVRSALRYGSALQRIVALGVPLLFIVVAFFNPAALVDYLILWLFPLVVFFQVSTILRLCVKHSFPPPGPAGKGTAVMASLTGGVFVGEPFPSVAGSLAERTAAYSGWLLRMAFIHFPSRYLVLTGDAVCHDFHHRHPKSREWSNYIFARQADQDAGHLGWPAYQECWGLVPAINHVLDSLIRADPQVYNRDNLGHMSTLELYDSFDD